MKSLKFSFFMALVAMFAFVACNKDDDEQIDYSPEREQMIIDEYIAFLGTEGYDVDTTSTGLFYVTIEEGEGDFVQANDTVEVTYLGYFTNGEVFDSSIKDDDGEYFLNNRFRYIHGETGLIQGWNEGMELMNKGAKLLLFIKSDLAYGPYWYRSIPPYSPLVFELELHSINEVEL